MNALTPITLKPLLNRKQAAQVLGVSHRTLEKWTCTGDGPVFLRIGRKVMYHEDALVAWITQRQYASSYCHLEVVMAS